MSDEQKAKIELHIVGATEEQLKSVCGTDASTIEQLKGILTAHGRVSHDRAIAHVRDADYTLLFRDASLRYAKAGFPTKIVESLSCGTPPVCNLSSDLGLYLKDGENAHIAADHSSENIKTALEQAINTCATSRTAMRVYARKTAEEYFDYNNYTEVLAQLLN